MTIEERHKALAEHVDLLTHEVRAQGLNIERQGINIDRLNTTIDRLSTTVDRLAATVTNLTTTVHDLYLISQVHEHRLGRLEQPGPANS